jgi:hypothetical protein
MGAGTGVAESEALTTPTVALAARRTRRHHSPFSVILPKLSASCRMNTRITGPAGCAFTTGRHFALLLIAESRQTNIQDRIRTRGWSPRSGTSGPEQLDQQPRREITTLSLRRRYADLRATYPAQWAGDHAASGLRPQARKIRLGITWSTSRSDCTRFAVGCPDEPATLFRSDFAMTPPLASEAFLR